MTLLLRRARLVDLDGSPRAAVDGLVTDGAGPVTDGAGAPPGRAGSAGVPRVPDDDVALVDVRIADGVVSDLGPALTALPGDDVVDVDGRWLLPGLWDAHTHMAQWALHRRRLDVSAARSAAEAAALVVERLRTAPLPAGARLVGAGFRDGLWPDEPTAHVLDGALVAAGLPPTPVVLVSADVHCAWLSSPALANLGRGDHPTGLLRETEWMPLMAVVDDAPTDVRDAWVHEAALEAASRGVVGVVDVEIDDNLAAWVRREERGTCALRVRAGVWPEHLEAAVARGLRTGDRVPGARLVELGPLKVIADGSLNTRTAWCHDPYPGLAGPDARGVLNVPADRLVDLLARATANGVDAAVHAIGDAAVGVVLDAFEATGARGSVEHAQLLGPDDVARMARLGVVASVQPEHAMDDRDVADHHWAGRTARAFPLADLARAGVAMTFGSDAPVAALDPWAAVAAAVHRSRDGREPWHPEQRLDVRTALRSSVRSRIAVGQRADVVVLEHDPLDAGAELRRTRVAGTLLGGRWTHRDGV